MRTRIIFHGKLFIGYQWVQPSTTSTIKVINPTTEELYVTVLEA